PARRRRHRTNCYPNPKSRAVRAISTGAHGTGEGQRGSEPAGQVRVRAGSETASDASTAGASAETTRTSVRAGTTTGCVPAIFSRTRTTWHEYPYSLSYQT